MVERLIKIIKQGLMVMVTTNIQSWDLLLPMILLGINVAFKPTQNIHLLLC
jgi:hypothetical protein